MKRLVLVLLASVLLALSVVQFRLVAAPPGPAAGQSGLQVLSDDVKQYLDDLRQRLDQTDPASAKLKSLLDQESGRVAVAGLIEQLRGQYLAAARSEAIPRFMAAYFEADDRGKLVIRPSHQSLAESWKDRSDQLGTVVASMRERLQGIAARLDDQKETDQLAKRLLSDPELAFTLLIQEFNGRADPVDLYLDKAMEKVLVRRGETMVVIPSVGEASERKIDRMEFAAQVFERLRNELPVYVDAFATPDERHQQLVKVLKGEAAAAIMALQLAKDGGTSATAAVDELFGKIEDVARETADGLLIEDENAWKSIGDVIDLAQRTSKRAPVVQAKMNRLALKLDTQDPQTVRFAKVLRSGVLAYQAAAEIPYAEFDLGREVENAIAANLEPTDDGRLTVKTGAAEEITRRADEWLTACRTVRRYLLRIDDLRDRLADRELAESLDGPGRMLLFAEVKRHAESLSPDPMRLLRDELLRVNDASDTITVRADRADWVDEMAERAEQLQSELSKDDF